MCGAIALCLLALTGCAPPGGTRPLVKIGLAAPFEGHDRPLGYEALKGVKLALAERNAAGGVEGYMVELVALNDFAEPGEAQLQAKEFAIDPAVVGVVTGWTESTARASLPIYRQEGLAVAVPWSVPPELADRDAGVVLVAATTQQVAEVLAKAVAATHPRRVALVGDDPGVLPYVGALRVLGLSPETISPPGTVGGAKAGRLSQEEWATRLVLGRPPPPDALVLTTDGAMAGESLLALAALGWAGTAFGGAETGSVHLVSVAGEVTDGLIFASPAPAGRDVTAGYDDLSPRAVLAYDATHVLLDAIELAIRQNGRPTRSGVAAALPTVRRQGLTGPISFDPAGRRIDAPVWLYNVVNKGYPGRMWPTADGR